MPSQKKRIEGYLSQPGSDKELFSDAELAEVEDLNSQLEAFQLESPFLSAFENAMSDDLGQSEAKEVEEFGEDNRAFDKLDLDKGSKDLATDVDIIEEQAPIEREQSKNFYSVGFEDHTSASHPNNIYRQMPATLEKINPPKKGSRYSTYTILKRSSKIDFLKKYKRKIIQKKRVIEFSIGDVLLKKKIIRRHPKYLDRFQIPLNSYVAYPQDPSNKGSLPESDKTFPVVLIAHGQHDSFNFRKVKLKDTGSKHGGLPVYRPTSFQLNPTKTYQGFKYLQEELATHGIVSMSVDANVANFLDEPPPNEMRTQLMMRGELILWNLYRLYRLNKEKSSPFYQRLDFSRVGLLGHSRGGDAVVAASVYLKGDRWRKRLPGVKIKSIVSLAPVDSTGVLKPSRRLVLNSRRLHYLVLYGSHDGDVDTREPILGTGFRHFDRALCQKAMLFVHGATHNRFNRILLTDESNVRRENKRLRGKENRDDTRVLTRIVHEGLAKVYVGGWFRRSLNSERGLEDRFTGAQAIRVRGRGDITVSTQWSFGSRIRIIDDFQGPLTKNRLSGVSKRTSFVERWKLTGLKPSRYPHQTRYLKVSIKKKYSRRDVSYLTEIPARYRDFSRFDFLTFRMTKYFKINVKSQKEIDKQGFPHFFIQLTDESGSQATVDHNAIYNSNAHAPTLPYHRFNYKKQIITLTPFETLSAPLSLFSKAKVNLKKIKSVAFKFDASKVEIIYIDDIRLISI